MVKKLLLVLFLLVFVGCANTLAQTPINPPPVITIVSQVECGQAGKAWVQGAWKSPATFMSWTEGMKAEHNLDVKEIRAEVTILSMDETGTYYAVYLKSDLTILCLDENGLHKTAFVESIGVVGVDKTTKQVIWAQWVLASPIKIEDGWGNLKDI